MLIVYPINDDIFLIVYPINDDIFLIVYPINEYQRDQLLFNPLTLRVT